MQTELLYCRILDINEASLESHAHQVSNEQCHRNWYQVRLSFSRGERIVGTNQLMMNIWQHLGWYWRNTWNSQWYHFLMTTIDKILYFRALHISLHLSSLTLIVPNQKPIFILFVYVLKIILLFLLHLIFVLAWTISTSRESCIDLLIIILPLSIVSFDPQLVNDVLILIPSFVRT